jgi:calpain-7
VDYAPAVPLNVTLFPGATSGTGLGRHIATSGSYSDALPGVSLPETQLAAGSYVLVPSTFRPGVQARFRIIVYSSVGGLRFVRKQ